MQGTASKGYDCSNPPKCSCFDDISDPLYKAHTSIDKMQPVVVKIGYIAKLNIMAYIKMIIVSSRLELFKCSAFEDVDYNGQRC